MAYRGRITALAAAIGLSGGAALYGLWPEESGLLRASAGALLFAAVSIPVGWWLGRKYDRLARLAVMDPLTGVYNRRFVENGFVKLAARAGKQRKRMAVLLIDVNDFKQVNDSHGHAKGDAAIREVAAALRHSAERGEIVARWGGDEFMVICPYADDKAVAVFSRKVRDRLEHASLRTGFRLAVSAGVASYPADGARLSQLAQLADERMYADKQSGKRHKAEEESLQEAQAQ
ncbi:GGDEF domain-containing protein [Paenibacillus methanolicus]|uniref:Diguanylate cyclase (GGDEF)-like protein n=1 Tax=Paenibacillus methanolicus TaxID=582686 RepID=A0A5S5BVW0_9BACL|nr:GGDEF domain-containing protein [Paenibacillus methanolicus]TYP70322.1 diguanylate cyclase (GGDEF)-like protein [Paenibacillus methanolicus]